MEKKKTLERHAESALKNLNKSVKKVFGLNSLAEVAGQIACIENIFRDKYKTEPEVLTGEAIRGFPIPFRSGLREQWAKYLTLKHYHNLGMELVLYKNAVLRNITREDTAWNGGYESVFSKIISRVKGEL